MRSWIARASGGEGGSPSAAASSAARLLERQRAQHQLVEPAGAAQVVAQAPDAVVAREPVGAVGGDHQHRQLAERLGERGQQLERRLVGPLQVVEDDQRVPLGGDPRRRRSGSPRTASGDRPPARARRARAAAARAGRAAGPAPRARPGARAGSCAARPPPGCRERRRPGSARRAARRRPSRRRGRPRAASCRRRPRRSAARSSPDRGGPARARLSSRSRSACRPIRPLMGGV